MNPWIPAGLTIGSTVLTVVVGYVFLAGKLVERIATNTADIGEVKTRLDGHDTRLNSHGERISSLAERVEILRPYTSGDYRGNV